MTKLLFLDFDGVLNHRGCNDTLNLEGFGKHTGIAKECIECLNTICKSITSLQVVISSDWRKHYTLDQLNLILKTYGFIGKAVGVTPYHKWRHSDDRGIEIRDYIIENYSRDDYLFVAIDDNDWGISKMCKKMNDEPGLQQGLYVQTCYTTGGLTARHVDQVISFFNTS